MTTSTAFVTADLDRIELHDGWIESDETVRARFAFPMFWATGNASTSVLYAELDPGHGGPRHTDTPEELLLVLEGRVEVELDGATTTLEQNQLVLIPALVPHSFRNVGETKARVVGFFSANTVVARFEEPVQPLGRRTLGTPTPGLVLGEPD